MLIGQKAPSFSAKTHQGKVVNLNLSPVGSLITQDHVGSGGRLHPTSINRNGVLLWFYPSASVGGSTVEGKKFQELIEDYQAKGVSIVGVSNESEADSAKFAQDACLSYPLICDPNLGIAMAYGAAVQGAKAANPTAVLIGKDGNIAQLWPKVDAAECLKNLP